MENIFSEELETSRTFRPKILCEEFELEYLYHSFTTSKMVYLNSVSINIWFRAVKIVFTVHKLCELISLWNVCCEGSSYSEFLNFDFENPFFLILLPDKSTHPSMFEFGITIVPSLPRLIFIEVIFIFPVYKNLSARFSRLILIYHETNDIRSKLRE